MQYEQQQASQQGTMKPLTAKELEYIVDSISNEDLLMKQCAATAASCADNTVRQSLVPMVGEHQQHINTLLDALKQHAQIAPNTSQQSQ